jgi:hypothetical protein
MTLEGKVAAFVRRSLIERMRHCPVDGDWTISLFVWSGAKNPDFQCSLLGEPLIARSARRAADALNQPMADGSASSAKSTFRGVVLRM